MSADERSTASRDGAGPHGEAGVPDPGDRPGGAAGSWCRTSAVVGPSLRRAGDRALLGLPVAATALLATASLGAAVAPAVSPLGTVGPAAAQPCSAEVRPDTVTIRHRPVRVLVRVPAGLGEARGVEAPEASGVEVLGVETDAAGQAWIVRLDLSGARAGRWRLVLRGGEGSCEGRMTTRMPGRSAPIELTSRPQLTTAHGTNARRRR